MRDVVESLTVAHECDFIPNSAKHYHKNVDHVISHSIISIVSDLHHSRWEWQS